MGITPCFLVSVLFGKGHGTQSGTESRPNLHWSILLLEVHHG